MNIVFENVGKRFLTLRGRVDALKEVNLQIEDGEFFILLGPSGCGKSTTLNLAAGLERPTRGVIRFGSDIVADAERRIMIPPGKRNVAMVFQSYALYPHMNVFDNIAFPLKIAKMKKPEIRARVDKTVDILGIGNLLDRKPGELSGGQRQRVSIARALVREPALFLLDEPLSNLDAQLRTSTRAELKRLQKELGVTTIYVTHDQTEAMTLGDRIALFNKGRLVQCAAPRQMYDAPDNPFSAAFIGSPPMNLVPVEIHEQEKGVNIILGNNIIPVPVENRRLLSRISGKNALLGIRPEHIVLDESRLAMLSGKIRTVELLGREVIYHVEVGGNVLVALSENRRYAADQNVGLSFPPDRIHLFEPLEPMVRI